MIDRILGGEDLVFQSPQFPQQLELTFASICVVSVAT